MVMAKLRALTAEGRTGWANACVESKQRKLILLDSFILHSPIPGIAHGGRPTPALVTHSNSLADGELSALTDGIEKERFYSSFELRQVAKRLISEGWDGDRVPTGSSEFICMSISPQSVLKKTYGLFDDISSDAISTQDRNAYSSLLRLDALYRHVRNSLAHGLFKEVTRKAPDGKRRPYLYLQDNNSSRQITARMYLSYERLERWAQAFSGSGNR